MAIGGDFNVWAMHWVVQGPTRNVVRFDMKASTLPTVTTHP